MVAESDGPSLYAAASGPADRNEPLPASVLERDGHAIPSHDASGYSILEQPMGTLRPLRVILMGAGASALNFFHQAELSLPHVAITCYEKNADVGGTWLENRYPGCACDIPSVNYQFSWRVRPWTHYYSSAPEIWRYLKDIERDGDFVRKYVRLRHRVERAEWDDAAGVWRVAVRDLATDAVRHDEAEFFINAGGVLNKWRWPDVPGLHDFAGKLMHSASYDEGYPLAGKRVAVLGAGSSGVQIVARVQREVAHLYHWVRSPVWITAGFGQTWAAADGNNFACESPTSPSQAASSTGPSNGRDEMQACRDGHRHGRRVTTRLTGEGRTRTHGRHGGAAALPARQPGQVPRVPQAD